MMIGATVIGMLPVIYIMMKVKIYKCPVCENDVPEDQIFLHQIPKELPKPIACIECVNGLYWAINKIN